MSVEDSIRRLKPEVVKTNVNESESYQQVDIGLVEHKNNSAPVLVIAEAWPSFAFALDAVGYTNVEVWLKPHILPLLVGIQAEGKVLQNFTLMETADGKITDQILKRRKEF